ncbi:flagellar motor switch protein FliM [Heyndrickxia shackletonii]|uniref:Flagellar motor switch protein FliM n=1 Tax=Heyndrickxia shackletonii TaxID=157838 RepID=A0A0Q3TLQ3_9BACI|nr:flagellar motor switch protein FliM [Heyndrickxia shackletonii]KQL54625.1 flagellar motor switch protein FliM [Heyndrickxia shackletonii]MBB2478660.1 flagellar motor switch protein FliM [Bacillus sp. APMAM]NEY98271.1 flagellar motor switch protein FliM [Heyndrickxia shackletonii]RTZ57802.1 flagellar motor switch protein FliM [Bacillus sp. SAJ1]
MSGEVLSQNEIDALLSALSTGEMNAEDIKKEEEAKKVKVYDFKRALRFSKDQIRSLTRIHENFARLLTTFFSAQLRTYVQISVASADQIPYEEFIRSIPKMTILNVFEVPPLEGRILMEINPNIAYAMMDRVMGGKGTSVNKVDNLTEIEKRIMSNMFDRAFENYQEAWANMVDIDPYLSEFEVNPQFLQMVSPNETVVVISMNTTIGDASGMINLCIPHVALEPIIPKLSVHYWMQTNHKEREPAQTELMEKKLKNAFIPLVAQLGSSEITIEDFLNLDKGDIIPLVQKIDDPIKINIEGTTKFVGQPGIVGKRMAIQILEVLRGGDDDSE